MSLDLPNAWLWSTSARPVSVRERVFQSAASGSIKVTDVEFHALLTSFDWLKYLKKVDGSTNLPRYNLNTVAAHFLGKDHTKADMNYEDLPTFFYHGPEARKLEALYCMQDVDLLWRISNARKPFHQMHALSESSGISWQDMMNKGQTHQSTLLLLPICNEAGYAKLWRRKSKEASFQGATVIPPNRGLYKSPVVTLDFASLYPSIMSAYNVCFTTVVFKPVHNLARQTRLLVDKIARLPGEGPRGWFGRVYRVAVSGEKAQACLETILDSLDEDGVPQKVVVPPVVSTDILQFIIRKEHKAGLLPTIVEGLMAARKKTKAAMKKAEGMEKLVMNAKQKAQKLTQNSMYGSASLQWRAVGLLTTFFGRQLIKFTTEKAQELGTEWDARVVYGDTDSVFVKLSAELLIPKPSPGASRPTKAELVAEARRVGLWLESKLNARYVSELGLNGIQLECEAVLMPAVLTAKKRYVAQNYEVTGSGTRYKGIYARGMANVRGDQPLFVKNSFTTAVEILIHRGLKQAVIYVQCLGARLLQGGVKLEDLILHKGYRKEFYADPVPGHIQLARRMGLKPGNQVPFVLCKAPAKALQAEKMESPRSVGKNGCEVSYEEYLQRYVKPTFSGLLAVPLTQQEDEMGKRFEDAKESAKDLEQRKKASEKFIFERTKCSVCQDGLSLAMAYPVHTRSVADSASLKAALSNTGKQKRPDAVPGGNLATVASRTKKPLYQKSLFSVWAGLTTKVQSHTTTNKEQNKVQGLVASTRGKDCVGQGEVSEEAEALGKWWLLCPACVRFAVRQPGLRAPVKKELNLMRSKRFFTSKMSAFRPERSAAASSSSFSASLSSCRAASQCSTKQSTLHASRKRTLHNSFRPKHLHKKQRKQALECSQEQLLGMRDWRDREKKELALYDATCIKCRASTGGLDPKDCVADSCPQFYSRDASRVRVAEIEELWKNLVVI